MADQQPNHVPDYDSKVRATIAYIWTGAAIILVSYTLVMYGHILAVLTLIIGYYTGVTGAINGVYFGGVTAKKPDTQVSVTGDNQQTTVVPNTPTDAPAAASNPS